MTVKDGNIFVPTRIVVPLVILTSVNTTKLLIHCMTYYRHGKKVGLLVQSTCIKVKYASGMVLCFSVSMESRKLNAENAVGVPFVSMESTKPRAENAVGVPFVNMESGKPSAENVARVPFVSMESRKPSAENAPRKDLYQTRISNR